MVTLVDAIMPHWMLKAIVQKGLSQLPGSHRWNHVLQQYVTGSLRLDPAFFARRLLECRRHLENYLAVTPGGKAPSSVFELGTGWHPIIPVGLYLCGTSRVWTFDIFPWLRRTAVNTVVHRFLEYAKNGKLHDILPWVQETRLTRLRDLVEGRSRSAAEALERLGISARVGDARSTHLDGGSIDFILSNSTLQYISPDVLRGIFCEFRRLATAHAVMSHFIGISDDYAMYDRAISPFNFLRYSPPVWRLISNPLHYQNRLRPSDYRRIHRSTDFEVLREEIESGSEEDLSRVRLAEEFRRYSREELLALNSWMVSIPVMTPLPDTSTQLDRRTFDQKETAAW